ncbi:MAG: MFS transporter, partial [bacterium]
MMRTQTQRHYHHAWIVLGAASLVLLGASGVRSSFGVFIKPLEAEFGSGRTSMSTIAALSLLIYGAVGPIVGRMADRWGPRGVLIGAAVLLGIGALASAAV